jgi:branched-chain amino acid aminotransferase
MAKISDQDGVIWKNGKLEEWRDCKTHALTHGLHYGSGVFEGIRAYEGKVFKAKEHFERFLKSGELISLDIPYTVEEMIEATYEVMKKNNLSDCYIRPLAYKNDDSLGIKSSDVGVDVIISAWAWGSYYGKDGLKLGKTEWRKPDPRTAPVQAKASGMYVTASMNNNEAQKKGYNDMLMLDVDDNVAECTVSNIFFIAEDGVVHTPSAEGFLNGITRQTIIQLANREGIELIERKIKPEELGSFVAGFTCGTAAEVAPIAEVWDDYKYDVNNKTLQKLKKLYEEEVRK